MSLLIQMQYAAIGYASRGTKIAFTCVRNGNLDICVMVGDGGNKKRLTDHPARDYEPSWSPDGTRIAFVSTRHKKHQHIFVIDSDGRNLMELTGGSEPAWSPDGGEIAFTSWRDDWNWDIYVIGADRRGLKRVTHDLAPKFRPAFSPDGGRIAYMSGHEGFNHIYVVGADGRNRVRLTHNQENHLDPAWSTDGQAIAYGNWDGILDGNLLGTIHLMTADGKYLKQLGDVHDARDFEPDFSPLGLAVSPASKTAAIWGRLKKSASNVR